MVGWYVFHHIQKAKLYIVFCSDYPWGLSSESRRNLSSGSRCWYKRSVNGLQKINYRKPHFSYVLNTSWATLIEKLEVRGRENLSTGADLSCLFIQGGDPEFGPTPPMSSSAAHLHHCQHKGDWCSPAVNMNAARSKNVRNVEGGIWKGNRSSDLFTPLNTCHLLQKEGVAVGFLDFQKYVLAMHTQLFTRLKEAFYRFRTFWAALERV